MTPTIGLRYVANFVDYSDLDDPSYDAHTGQVFTITKFCPANDAGDRDIWTVEADDGWVGHAFEEELTPAT